MKCMATTREGATTGEVSPQKKDRGGGEIAGPRGEVSQAETCVEKGERYAEVREPG